jgi:iron(III) transport system substrate-binding protein
VVKGAPNPANARAFFDFLVSRAAQDVLGQFGNYPVVTGAVLPQGGVDVPSEQVIDVDYVWSAANRSRILDTFQQVTQAEPQ